ncbi:ORF6N domain-containing protein [bacterium]|nr:ORF6N domain-containing protein [bacterium]
MDNSKQVVSVNGIQNRIFTIRGVQVVIDRDLAELYHVENKRLNEQVRRNIERFPIGFRFQLDEIEKNELVAICDRFKSLKHSVVNPYVFTEQGVSMLSAVLRSKIAIAVSIEIMNAFVEMRHFIQSNEQLFTRMDSMECRQIAFECETGTNFEKIFQALEHREELPKQGIFYDGQVYDAYSFASDLIRSAKQSLILIDNYVDDSVLTLLSKRLESATATIYTKSISKQLALDLKRHNTQYPNIQVKQFKDAHDRFLIIDETEIYHIGASMKDLGKKWFAFSKLEILVVDILNKLGSCNIKL